MWSWRRRRRTRRLSQGPCAPRALRTSCGSNRVAPGRHRDGGGSQGWPAIRPIGTDRTDSMMTSATSVASVRGQGISAPEERGIRGLKFSSGVTDAVSTADRALLHFCEVYYDSMLKFFVLDVPRRWVVAVSTAPAPDGASAPSFLGGASGQLPSCHCTLSLS